MSIYLVFFGKSQDFTTCYYNRTEPIQDFNTIIKDFDILESKTFTVDDIKNKEILSRYFFSTQGRNFCLLKLYSFAQAHSGSRIAGSIYGVGLLSEDSILFTKDNLALLRAAKDNFAKLSLDGVKFNKSNCQGDTDRIWKAIVTSNDGNLLDKVSTSALKLNGSDGPFAFYVSELFGDAIKLNDRISNQDDVYFSEDLEHLKRTQIKWGKDAFPIYWEQNKQFVQYKEPVARPTAQAKNQDSGSTSKGTDNNEVTVAKLRAELSDNQYNTRNLQQELGELHEKYKLFTYIIYGISGLILLLLLYILFFSRSKPDVVSHPPDNGDSDIHVMPQIDTMKFLTNINMVDSGIGFLKSVKYIYSFDVIKSLSDSLIFKDKFNYVNKVSLDNNILIENVRDAYSSKLTDIKLKSSVENKPKKREKENIIKKIVNEE